MLVHDPELVADGSMRGNMLAFVVDNITCSEAYAMDLQRWSSSAPGVEAEVPEWFSFFPADHWRSLVGSLSVTLTVACDGGFRVLTRGSDSSQEVVYVGSGDTTLSHISERVRSWAWVEAEPGGSVRDITWSVDDMAAEPPPAFVVVPTFRREEDATLQAERFLRMDGVHRVLVVDQGGTLGAYSPFQALVEIHGERLILVGQANFGGSGGYARGMVESLEFPGCAVFLSDDDAAVPEEALRRMRLAQALAAQRGRKVVLGTPMLSAETPATLVSAAEWVAPKPFQWKPADGLSTPISVSGSPTHFADPLVLNVAPNYAGWWGALLPPGMVAQVGLPAPYFLKWDDAEFGLRASSRGYEFAVIPGTGAWHPTWGAWKTLTTWVAVLLHRNRLATAAAYQAGRGVVIDSLVHQVKHVLSLQYDVAELWAAGIDSVLDGPAWLSSDLSKTRGQAQSVVDRLPGRMATTEIPPARGRLSVPSGAFHSLTGLLRKSTHRQTSCEASSFTWRDGLGQDRVVLLDEGDAFELVRDSSRARTALWVVLQQHARLLRDWSSLRARYAPALRSTTTLQHWRRTFGMDDGLPDPGHGPREGLSP